jgi:hypothetical protein
MEELITRELLDFIHTGQYVWDRSAFGHHVKISVVLLRPFCVSNVQQSPGHVCHQTVLTISTAWYAGVKSECYTISVSSRWPGPGGRS